MNIHEYQTKDLLKHYGVPVPPGRVVHTDAGAIGQVYLPLVNVGLAVATIAAVLGFGSSDALAGAYGAAMASNYNTRLRVPEVLVRGDTYSVIKPRETYEQLIAGERLT